MTTLNLESALKLAQEAKELRCKAQLVEKKAVKSFRCARTKYVKALQKEDARLEEEKKNLETECFALAHTFCEQKGSHSYIVIKEARPYGVPRYYSWGGAGVKYYNTTICSICGNSDNPKDFYKNGCQTAIQEAAEQTENLELKETAKRILEIQEQIKKITNKLSVNHSSLERICSLFGHDVKSNKFFDSQKCECCGYFIGESEYNETYYAAKYKGIVPYLYDFDDDSTIL